jgi:hypothetical protein
LWGGAVGGVENQGEEGLGEGVVSGEANGTIEPQPVGVESGRPAKGVVAGIVVEAGEVAVVLEGAENGHVRYVECGLELLESGDGAAVEVGENGGLEGGKGHCYSMWVSGLKKAGKRPATFTYYNNLTGFAPFGQPGTPRYRRISCRLSGVR